MKTIIWICFALIYCIGKHFLVPCNQIEKQMRMDLHYICLQNKKISIAWLMKQRLREGGGWGASGGVLLTD